jgi:hypothetical protein
VLSVETTSPDRLSSFVFAVPIGAGINHDPPTCPSRSWQYPTAGGYGMSIWQYLQLDLNELAAGDSEVDALNAVGKNGWELVTFDSRTYQATRSQLNLADWWLGRRKSAGSQV